MEDKKKTFKEWFKEHKNDIMDKVIVIGVTAAGFGLGYFTSKKITRYTDALVIDTLIATGVIKLYDPETGLEIGPSKVLEVAEKTLKK